MNNFQNILKGGIWKVKRQILETPLLSMDSTLDERSRELISRIYKEEQQKALTLPTDDPTDSKRKKRVEYTIEEIYGQPDAVAKTLSEERQNIKEAAYHLTRRKINKIYMTGCGDSIAALHAARMFLEELLDIPCEAMQALDFAYYGNKIVDENTLVIILSSSGATVRAVEAMLVARNKGAQTISLSNTAGSPLMVESTRGLLIHAERKGWPTQSSTSATAMVMQLGIDMAAEYNYDPDKLKEFQETLDSIPNLMKKVTEISENDIAEIAKIEAQKEIYLFAGGGPSYSSAIYGAAKVKETTPNHAIYIPLEEFHHYNSQKKGDPLFIISPSGYSIPRAMDTVHEGQRFGGTVYVITTEGEDSLASAADRAILLPKINEYFCSLLYSIPIQLFGYYVAMEKFCLAEKEVV